MHSEEKPVILALGKLPEVGERFGESCTVLEARRHTLDDLVHEFGPRIRMVATRGGMPVHADLLAALPALELVAGFGVGYDSIDAAAAARRGVVVSNTPGVLDAEVADFTVGLLLATVRKLPQADRYIRTGKWLEAAFPLGASLRDRRIGLVGMGRIGQAIARRLAAFDLPIAYHARHRVDGLPYDYHADLESLAKNVEVLIVIVPGGEGTRHLVNAQVLRTLGPTGILINVARGSVVDEAALVEALQHGTILGAGLDVFADEPRLPEALLQLENVVLTPHIGSGTFCTRSRMSELMLDNIAAWLEGRPALTPVPETPDPRQC